MSTSAVSPALLLIAAVMVVGAFFAGRWSMRAGRSEDRPAGRRPRSGVRQPSNHPRDSRAAPPSAPPPPPPADTGRAIALAEVRSWGYQLQKLKIDRAAGSPFDLLVIDYSFDGSDERALRPADLERMRIRPDGRRRLILAYLSIGEAESYRYYWQPQWQRQKPDWLLGENPEWKENFAVCFWHRDWQRLMCGTTDAYLDRIIEAGFDGVYLDKCDVFEDLARRHRSIAATRRDMEADMVQLVATVSTYAKARRPDFLVVMQNAETLLRHHQLLETIDAVAKEELFFGQDGGERRNRADDVREAKQCLDLAHTAGKPVLLVEYLADQRKITEAATLAKAAGFILYIAPKDRELDRLAYEVLEA